MFRYSYFGAVLHSPYRFEVLPPPPEDVTNKRHVMLKIGDVPRRLEREIWSNGTVIIGEDCAVLFNVPGVGKALVSNPTSIIFEPVPRVDAKTVQMFIISMVAAAVLHQLRLLPLHASCVRLGSKTIALLGPSGRGKSTLAAAAVKRGAKLICEDITPVYLMAEEPFVFRGALGIRLLEDSALSLLPAQNTTPVAPRINKVMWHNKSGTSDSFPLNAMVRIEVAGSPSEVGVSQLSGEKSILPLKDTIYRSNMAKQMGHLDELREQFLLASSKAPIYSIRRPNELSSINLAVDLLHEV